MKQLTEYAKQQLKENGVKYKVGYEPRQGDGAVLSQRIYIRPHELPCELQERGYSINADPAYQDAEGRYLLILPSFSTTRYGEIPDEIDWIPKIMYRTIPVQVDELLLEDICSGIKKHHLFPIEEDVKTGDAIKFICGRESITRQIVALNYLYTDQVINEHYLIVTLS